MGCLGIILLWIVCGLGIIFPPFGIIVVIIAYIWLFSKPGNKKVKIHYSKISFPPCRPFSYEMEKDGMVWAKPYRDKNWRIRYCCNPNHNHYHE